MDRMAFLPGMLPTRSPVCELMSGDFKKEMDRLPDFDQYDPGDDRETE